MGNHLKHFVFVDHLCPPSSAEDVHFGQIPAGISEKTELLAAVKKTLNLAPYMGNNLDALNDCIRSLEDTRQYKVILAHEDIPALLERDLRLYFSILGDAAEIWDRTAEHELKIYMPVNVRDDMMKFLLI